MRPFAVLARKLGVKATHGAGGGNASSAWAQHFCSAEFDKVLSPHEHYNMFETIEYNKSAFKHRISEEDIHRAFFHYRYDGPVDNMENKYIRIGFDRSGNLLEIMYNEIDEHTVNVFHAMPCRSIYYPLLNI